jgi:hypothetical protein
MGNIFALPYPIPVNHHIVIGEKKSRHHILEGDWHAILYFFYSNLKATFIP